MRRFFTWALPVLLLLICVPLVLFLLAGTLGARADQEALALAEESVRRAAVQCYALEGAYPQDLPIWKSVTASLWMATASVWTTSILPPT